MTILQVSPDSSELVRAAAALVLYLHIGAGGVGLLSGTAALIFRKGSRLHGLAGKFFVVSMLIMSAIGACVAPFLPVPERASVLAGALTFYLVLSSWMTVRRKAGTAGRSEVGVLCGALCITGTAIAFIWMAAHSPTGTLDGQPRQAFYVFLIVGALALVGDIRLLLRRGVAGATRLARHLWRMCVALLIAAASLFLGQQKMFPGPLRGSAWFFLPEILLLGALLFWLGKVALGAWRRQRRARALGA